MTQVPSGAQLSDDGQWWWDGSQWQPVPAPGAAAPAAAADPAAAPAQAAGQLSDDGQWQWDGTQWQPVQGAAPAASGAGAAPNAAQQGDQSGGDVQIQWDMSSASTGAVYTLNEQPDSQSDEQQA